MIESQEIQGPVQGEVQDLQIFNHGFQSDFSINLPGCLPVVSYGFLFKTERADLSKTVREVIPFFV